MVFGRDKFQVWLFTFLIYTRVSKSGNNIEHLRRDLRNSLDMDLRVGSKDEFE